jgi:hypothetical protein
MSTGYSTRYLAAGMDSLNDTSQARVWTWKKLWAAIFSLLNWILHIYILNIKAFYINIFNLIFSSFAFLLP